ncbi:LysR family transcriptional regulator [Elizabethkingia phage TCUEAP1]|nr:LysR family transcriptional regulator [Elizabethkingia phage TCUEAP1]
MLYRLAPDEAEALGFEIKQKPKIGNPKYDLSDAQVEQLTTLRNYSGLKNAASEDGVDLKSFPMMWLKTQLGSYSIRNPHYEKPEERSLKDFEDHILKKIETHAPSYIPFVRSLDSVQNNVLVINPADVHIGKLCKAFETGDDYTIDIAVRRVKEGVEGILNYASGYNIEKIIFVGGNDILHVDTPRNTTTSGTPQDVDGRWFEHFRAALDLYIELLERLTLVADVHFVYCPSNHDWQSGFFLCQAVEKFFSRNENITFDVSLMHRKYVQYGKNLIGFTHGDGGKVQDLPLSMAEEAAKAWAETRHRYIYMHHVHHKMSKDYQSVSVESMRSPSGTDGWHSRNQYHNNIKAIEGFIHNYENGQIARFNYIF